MRVTSAADIVVFNALSQALLPPKAEGPSRRSTPDGQTRLLADWIRSGVMLERKSVYRLLDFGAGIGRLATELAKESPWRLGANLDVHCWEPDPTRRGEMSRVLIDLGVKVTVIEDLSQVEAQSFDFSVLANVLHELPVPIAAEAISQAASLTRPTGEVAIVELCPLLKAEKFAVPYPEAIMKELLSSCNFAARSHSFSILGASAYAVLARRLHPDAGLSAEYVAERIQKTWARLLDDALSSYTSFQSLSGYHDFSVCLQDLTTIASITAHLLGRWPMPSDTAKDSKATPIDLKPPGC